MCLRCQIFKKDIYSGNYFHHEIFIQSIEVVTPPRLPTRHRELEALYFLKPRTHFNPFHSFIHSFSLCVFKTMPTLVISPFTTSHTYRKRKSKRERAKVTQKRNPAPKAQNRHRKQQRHPRSSNQTSIPKPGFTNALQLPRYRSFGLYIPYTHPVHPVHS